jgi:hypothetical protein
MNNLNEILTFIKKNKNYSDYSNINKFLNNLNFTNYKGGMPIETETPTVQTETSAQELTNASASTPVQTDTSAQELPNASASTPVQTDTSAQELPNASASTSVPTGASVSAPIVKQEMPKVNLPLQTEQQNGETNCITTSIIDEFGTTIERITCKNKNIIMPNLLIKPNIINSQVNTFTIKKGTILYHASKISGFNPREIKLGKDNLIAFFTPNFKLASFKVKGCDLDELNSYIHTFEVIKDIEKIFVKLPYTTGNINLDDLKNEFCTNSVYNGVGFFFPKNDIELFNNVLVDGNTLDLDKQQNDDSYYSEFALCNPNEWLKYLISHSCKSYRSLSSAFRMNA